MEKIRRIVVTGPESTGKTNIASYLAKKLNCNWIPEYARYYIENLNRRYNYTDVEKIALKQVEDYQQGVKEADKFIVFDTWLIITKVWFESVFGKYPDWLQDSINSCTIDLYLLCAPDIDWYPDSVRENGGESRIQLFNAYEKEIKITEAPYQIVYGNGQERYKNAEIIVEKTFNL